MDKLNQRLNPVSNSKVSKTVVLLGSCGVGKTNILQRYIKKKFVDTYIETIGKS